MVLEEEYLYIEGSSSLHFQLTHRATNSTIPPNEGALSRTYFLLHSNSCSLELAATLKEQEPTQSVWIRFNRNVMAKPFHSYSDTITMRKRRRYGLRIMSSDLPVLVELTPNQKHRRMDLDLFGYTERDFSSYFFPNVAERNHVDNAVEQLVVSGGDSYFEDGQFYFFEVYGSTDSAFSTMEYTLSVETNYAPHLLLKKVLLIFAFVIAGSFVLGIALSLLCNFGHRILFWLRVRSTPHRHGATKRQIRRLKVIRFDAERDGVELGGDGLESPHCIICLEDYAEGERVRILKCSHHFHAKCSDQWFFLNNKCPLCQQNIVDAEDVHQKVSAPPAEVEMVELQQLQRGEMLMDSEVDSDSDAI